MAIHFISYPRSGRVWTEKRMLLLLRLRDPKNANVGYLNRYFNNSHFGYDPNRFDNRPNEYRKFKKHEEVFILLRDPCATINSHYHYVYDYLPNKNKDLHLKKIGVGKNKNAFVRSHLGASRLCNYLNEVKQSIVPVCKTHFMYYEDFFDDEHTRVYLPRMLGIKEMTDEELEFVVHNSKMSTWLDGLDKNEVGMHLYNYLKLDPKKNKNERPERNGTVDSYKSEMSEDSQVYIRRYLRGQIPQGCCGSTLEVFNRRYL